MAADNAGAIAEIDKLRNNIEFASTSQFFHTFQSAFRPWPAAYNPASLLVQVHALTHRGKKQSDDDYVFTTEDLEKMMLDPTERYRLQELVVRMLRLLTRNRFINNDTWQMYFAREIDKRRESTENPFYRDDQDDTNAQEDIKQDEPVEQTKVDAEDQDVAMKDATQEEDVSQLNAEQEETTTQNDAAQQDVKPEAMQQEEDEQQQQPKKQRELINYFDMPLDLRVHLLHTLCEWQLDDAERFREHLDSEEDAVHWRVEPIGYDAKGSMYWLFDDNRLYKETPEPKKKPKPKKKPARKARFGVRRSTRRAAQAAQPEEEEEDIEDWVPWQLLCSTSQEWEAFPKRFESSQDPNEQQFHGLLVHDVLPKVLPVIKEHEEALKKKDAVQHRKRSSRLISRELEALERDHQQQQLLLTETTRRSSRREEMARKREEREKEHLANAREERLRERERRLMMREQAQAEDERRRALAESMEEQQAKEREEQAKRRMEQQQQQPAKRQYKRKQPDATTGVPKKRGRKPKQKQVDEDAWQFDCVCGVAGDNIDDGTPMIACERCGKWQHIRCLQKDGQLEEGRKSFASYSFFCKPCTAKGSQDVDIDGLEDSSDTRPVLPPPRKLTIIQSQPPPPPPPSSSSAPLSIPRPPMYPANGHHHRPYAPLQPWIHHQPPPPPPRQPLQQQQPATQQQPALAQHTIAQHAFPPIFNPMIPADSQAGNNGHMQYVYRNTLPPLLPQLPVPGVQPVAPRPVSKPPSTNGYAHFQDTERKGQ